MGAETKTYRVNWMSETELRKWFRDTSQQEAYEDGHGPYSGTLATISTFLIDTTKTFRSFADAERALGDSVRKWEAVAVPVAIRDPKLSDRDKDRVAKLEAEISERGTYTKAGKPGLRTALERAIPTLELEAVKAIQEGKNRFRSCPECESKIAVQHIKRLTCPVCGSRSLVVTPTLQKAMDAAESRLMKHDEKTKQLRAAIEEIRTKAPYYDETKHWFVYALCGS